MSIEYTPVDLACNLKCTYCYQEPMRDAGNIANALNWAKAKAELNRQNHKFSVFGGEPLLASIEHLEEVFQFGYERFGRNGIQTNGTLITERHIELFKKYGVGVGISCDGPDECSDLRTVGLLDETRLHTQRTLDSIARLCQAGVVPSIIITVHSLNGSAVHREKMISFFNWLEKIGVTDVNLHMLEVETGMGSMALSEEENTSAFLDFYRYSRTSKINFQPFRDIRRLLLNEELDKVNCIWNACDPLTTAAVSGVSRDGTRRNCGRVNKDGINWVKGDAPGKERYLVLHATPQEHGGCKDCRFFVFCKGNCPGTAIDGDWRNRSVHCSTWYSLFGAIEQDIIRSARLPISKDSARLRELELSLLDSWGLPQHKGIEVTWLSKGLTSPSQNL